MDVPSDLTKEYVYAQVLQCPNDKDTIDFEEGVRKYVNDVVNDKKQTLGLTFYKAQVSVSSEIKQFEIHFYLFSADHVPDQIENLLNAYLEPLLQGRMQLASPRRILERSFYIKRDPYYPSDEDEEPGCGNIPGDNICQKFINWWLIVPRVQCDFFDLLYQLYTFDITHQGFLAKFVHFFTIPCNVMLSMCFLAQFSLFGFRVGSGAYQLNGGFALFVVLVLMYMIMGLVRKSKTWGLSTSIVLLVCWLTGNLWYAVYKRPGNPWYNPTTIGSNPILWSYIISFIQASSHMTVPQMPPYITGVNHWESLHVFVCKKYDTTAATCKGRCFVVLAFLLFPVLSVAVAWFSWPHLIGTQVFYIMAGIGYQHSSFQKYQTVVEKAELSGNPGLDEFPTKPEELTQDASAFVSKLQKHDIVSKNPTHAEIVKNVTALNIYKTYFNRNSSTHHMLAARRGLHLTGPRQAQVIPV